METWFDMIDGIIFDIETGPLPVEQLTHRMPEFDAPGNIKDEAKKKAAIEKKQADWVDKAALDAMTGQILAIGMSENNGDVSVILDQHQTDEKHMLIAFWNTVTERRNARFIGFNIFGFDLPFLFRRSVVYGIQPSAILRGPRYWDTRFVDLMDVYTCGNRDQRISLDNLCKMLGIEGKSESGADFHKWFREEPAKARAYLMHDLEITTQVADRLLPWIETLKKKNNA